MSVSTLSLPLSQSFNCHSAAYSPALTSSLAVQGSSYCSPVSSPPISPRSCVKIMLSHEMPVPFGFSIGDCIAVCLLVKDMIRALDDVNGSKAEYQSVIRELGALDRALLQVVALQEVFGEGDGRTRELIALFGTVGRSVEGCKSCVGGFLEKIKGYEGALGSGEDGNANGDTHGNSLGSTSKSNPKRRSTVGRNLKESRERYLGHWGRRRS